MSTISRDIVILFCHLSTFASSQRDAQMKRIKYFVSQVGNPLPLHLTASISIHYPQEMQTQNSVLNGRKAAQKRTPAKQSGIILDTLCLPRWEDKMVAKQRNTSSKMFGSSNFSSGPRVILVIRQAKLVVFFFPYLAS